jgi:hypothetical protein
MEFDLTIFCRTLNKIFFSLSNKFFLSEINN